MEVLKALGCVPSPSLDRSLVLGIFIEVCKVVAEDVGKVPLGVILRYMAITGTPAAGHGGWHKHAA